MGIYKKLFYLFLTLSLFTSCRQSNTLTVKHSNSDIEYTGRVDITSVDKTDLFWSGTSIKFYFEGESVSALMKDESGDNYFNIILDEDSLFIFRPDTKKRYHSLVTGLAKGKHSIEIFKRTEWDRGSTSFYGLQINGNSKLLSKPISNKRRLEFYGNSITAGYAVEDFSGNDSPDSTYTNNYVSYAAITARHYEAEYQCICRSGIGITVSWVPEIMPEIYDKLDPIDPNSHWDFALYTPDVVVVNLFQNDSWLVEMPNSDPFKLRFINEEPTEEYIIQAYQKFVSDLRKQYPNAHIICTLGCMDAAKEGSKWIDYIKTATTNLDDKKIYTHIMPFIQAPAHPSIEDHEVMSKSLIGFIDENITW